MRQARSTAVALTIALMALCHPSLSFTIPPASITQTKNGPRLSLSRHDNDGEQNQTYRSRTTPVGRPSSPFDRRAFVLDTAYATLMGGIFATTIAPDGANAVSGVTVAEFEILVRDSAKSIKYVVFSGPKGETAIVTLADDTTFAITDIIESSSDPRSPLKLVATCRLNNVPTKFSALEDAVRSAGASSKKTKVYMNKRIQRAEELNKEKKIRMAQDEKERLEELESIRQQDGGR